MNDYDARQVTGSFVTALNIFQWNSDCEKFCEVLRFKAVLEYSQVEYHQFLDLTRYLQCFDPETLAKLISNQ